MMKTITALYERISQERQSEIYGLSIQHQKEILEKFANQNGFTPFRHFTDIGVSGTHFDRPGFQRMLEEIRHGRIDAVIVSDVSRFGRNYLESARYTEEIFPRHGVRFLSVLDDVDTFRDWEMEFLPFMHLIHDWYARESSRKGRQITRLRQDAGLRGPNSAPFGYLPDPEEWNHLIPDPDAAPIVQQIFRWALEGLSPEEITRCLNKQHIPTPRDLQRSRSDPDFIPTGHWHHGSVLPILRRETYTGTRLLHTHQVTIPGSHRTRPLPEDQQIRIPDSYEPIISQQNFDHVQELLPKRESPYEYNEILQPWENLLRHGIRRTPLTPKQYKGILRWGDSTADPPPLVIIRQAVLLDILRNTLLQLLREGLTPTVLARMQKQLKAKLEAARKARERLHRIADARQKFYLHELKRQYETSLRQHRPMLSPEEPDPLPSIQEQEEQLQAEIRQLQAALDWCASYAPESFHLSDALLPVCLSQVDLYPREQIAPLSFVMHIHVTPAFSCPAPERISEITVRPTRHVIHLIPKPDAPDLCSFLIRHYEIFQKEGSP